MQPTDQSKTQASTPVTVDSEVGRKQGNRYMGEKCYLTRAARSTCHHCHGDSRRAVYKLPGFASLCFVFGLSY